MTYSIMDHKELLHDFIADQLTEVCILIDRHDTLTECTTTKFPVLVQAIRDRIKFIDTVTAGVPLEMLPAFDDWTIQGDMAMVADWLEKNPE